MSHITRLKTKLRDLSLLKEILKEMGYETKENAEIWGWSQRKKVDIAIFPEESYPIGFVKKGDEIEVVADWWGIKINKEEFLTKIKKKYVEKKIIKEAKEKGFELAQREETSEGIRLILRKWE